MLRPTKGVLTLLALLAIAQNVSAGVYNFNDYKYSTVSSPDIVYRLKVYATDLNYVTTLRYTHTYQYDGSTGQSPPSPFLYQFHANFIFAPAGQVVGVWGSPSIRCTVRDHGTMPAKSCLSSG